MSCSLTRVGGVCEQHSVSRCGVARACPTRQTTWTTRLLCLVRIAALTAMRGNERTTNGLQAHTRIYTTFLHTHSVDDMHTFGHTALASQMFRWS